MKRLIQDQKGQSMVEFALILPILLLLVLESLGLCFPSTPGHPTVTPLLLLQFRCSTQVF